METLTSQVEDQQRVYGIILITSTPSQGVTMNCKYCEREIVESTVTVDCEDNVVTITKVAYCSVCDERHVRTITFEEEDYEIPYVEE